MRIEKENDKKNAFWAFGHKGAPNIFKNTSATLAPPPPPPQRTGWIRLCLGLLNLMK